MKIGLIIGSDFIKNYNKDKSWLSATYLKAIVKYLEKRNIDYITYNCSANSIDNNGLYKLNNYNGTNIEECTHFIGLEQSTFNYVNSDILNLIQQNCRGYITHISDIYRPVVDNVDILFYNIPNTNVTDVKKSLNIMYGCDENILFPNKNNNILEILIDHSYYGDDISKLTTELTIEILNKTANYFRLFKEKKTIIRRFISNGIEVIDISKPIKVDIYNRVGLPYEEACKIYNKTHVFVVTHKESLGYSIIESAMAGSLIVSFKNFIKPEYLNNFHHIRFDSIDDLDWDKIIRKIDINKSRQMALKFTWDTMFDKIINRLNLFINNNIVNDKHINILKLVFNNFDRNIEIFNEDNVVNSQLSILGYNVYKYVDFKLSSDKYYLFIKPNETFTTTFINNNMIYYIIDNNNNIFHKNIDKNNNVFFHNLNSELTEYLFLSNKEHILTYKNNKPTILSSGGLQICPIFKYRYNGKFNLSFSAKSDFIQKKIRIYNGKNWIIVDNELNKNYQYINIKCSLYHDTRSKPRISLLNPISKENLYIKNCIIKPVN